MPQSLFTRRYYIDSEGKRVLVGLTAEQTREFELLEALDISSDIDRASLGRGRWLELYGLHQQAWEIWRAERSKPNLTKVASGQSSLSNPI
jgi:hypothetical protein